MEIELYQLNVPRQCYRTLKIVNESKLIENQIHKIYANQLLMLFLRMQYVYPRAGFKIIRYWKSWHNNNILCPVDQDLHDHYLALDLHSRNYDMNKCLQIAKEFFPYVFSCGNLIHVTIATESKEITK